MFALIKCALFVFDEVEDKRWGDATSSSADSSDADNDAEDAGDSDENGVTDIAAGSCQALALSLVSAVAKAGTKCCVCFVCGKTSTEVCCVFVI